MDSKTTKIIFYSFATLSVLAFILSLISISMVSKTRMSGSNKGSMTNGASLSDDRGNIDEIVEKRRSEMESRIKEMRSRANASGLNNVKREIPIELPTE